MFLGVEPPPRRPGATCLGFGSPAIHRQNTLNKLVRYKEVGKMKTSYLAAIAVVAIVVIAAGYYLSQPAQPPQPKYLVVGTNTPFPPFEFVNSSGAITGFDIETIRALAQSAGYADITVKDMAFDSLITALQQGQIDVIAAGLTINAERQQQVNFTDPYWQADQSILIRSSSTWIPQGISDLAGKTVGVQTGTTGEGLADANNSTLGPIKRYDSFLLAVQDLLNGKLDAVIVDSPVAVAFTNQFQVKVASTVVTGEQWGFAVKIGNTALLNALNQALSQFKGSAQWNALISKYFGS